MAETGSGSVTRTGKDLGLGLVRGVGEVGRQLFVDELEFWRARRTVGESGQSTWGDCDGKGLMKRRIHEVVSKNERKKVHPNFPSQLRRGSRRHAQVIPWRVACLFVRCVRVCVCGETWGGGPGVFGGESGEGNAKCQQSGSRCQRPKHREGKREWRGGEWRGGGEGGDRYGARSTRGRSTGLDRVQGGC
jgi:hypothetical protein